MHYFMHLKGKTSQNYHQYNFDDLNTVKMALGKSWNGMEWIGMEWNGMDWNGMEWNGMDWNGMEWNGMEWNEMENSISNIFFSSQTSPTKPNCPHPLDPPTITLP